MVYQDAFFFCCCVFATQLADGSNAACYFLSVDEEDWNNWESIFVSTLVDFLTLAKRLSALHVNAGIYITAYDININTSTLSWDNLMIYILSYTLADMYRCIEEPLFS